jgi:hypothetical protein
MKHENVSSVIDNAEAISFLCDPTRHRFLEPFFKPQSVAKAATDLHEQLHIVYRQVKRMIRLGLIRETGVQHRAGRPIRLYSTVAQRFFVPFTHHSLQETLMDFNAFRHEQLVTSIASSWLLFSDTNLGWGTTIYRTPAGRIGVQTPTTLESMLSPIPLRPTLMRWNEMRLSRDDATALQAQLLEVLKTFERKTSPEHETYLVGLSMAALTTRSA